MCAVDVAMIDVRLVVLVAGGVVVIMLACRCAVCWVGWPWAGLSPPPAKVAHSGVEAGTLEPEEASQPVALLR